MYSDTKIALIDRSGSLWVIDIYDTNNIEFIDDAIIRIKRFVCDNINQFSQDICQLECM